MMKRKCFVCEEFGHIAYHCRNIREEGLILMPSNRFEVFKRRVTNIKEESGRNIEKNRKQF